MAAAVVGTAFVRIRALTKGLSKDIEKAVNKAVKDADFSKAAKALGQSFSDNAADEINKGLSDKVKIDIDGSESGKKLGQTFTEGAGKELSKASKDLGKKLTPEMDELNENLASRFAGLGDRISHHLTPQMEDLNRDLTARLEGIGDRVKLFKKLKVDKDFGKVTARELTRLFRNEEDNISNEFGGVFGRAFSRVWDAVTPDAKRRAGSSGTGAAKSFGDRFVAGLKKHLARLIPVLTPTLASLASFIVQYVVALGGQIALLLQAAAGGAVALGAAAAAVGTAILPLVAAFKVKSKDLDRFKAAGERVGKAWREFGLATQRTLLPSLTRSLNMTKRLIPVFSAYGREIGKIVGFHTELLAAAVTGEEGQRRFAEIFEGSAPIVENFMAIVIDLGDIISNLFIEALPVAQQFSIIIADMVDHWKNLVQVGSDNGTIAATFQDWFDKARLVFGALGDVFVAIGNIIQIGGEGSVPLFENFATWAADFRAFTETEVGENKIRQIFADAYEVAHAFNLLVIDIAKRIGGGIFEEGGNEGLVAFFDTLRLKIVPLIDEALRPLIEELGPQLTEFFLAFTDVMLALGQSGAIEVTVDALTAFTEVMTTLLNIPGMDKLAGTIIGIAGAFSVLKLVGITGLVADLGKFVLFFTKFASFAAVGEAISAAFAAAGGGLAGLGAVFTTVIAPILAVVAVIAAVIGAIVLLIIHWEKVMAAFEAVKRFIADPMARLERLGEILSNLGGIIVDKLAEALTALPGLISTALGELVDLGSQLGGVILDGLVTALSAIPGLVSTALGGLVDLGAGLGSLILEGLGNLAGIIVRNLPGLLLDALKLAFDVAFAGVKIAVRVAILSLLVAIFGLPLLILKGLTELGPVLVRIFQAAFDFVVNTLPGLLVGLVQFFTVTLPLKIIQALLGLGGILIRTFASVFSAVLPAVVGFFQDLPGNISDGLSVALPAILGFFTDLPGKIVDALAAAGPVVADFFTEVFGGLGETITDAFGDFGSVAGDIIGGFIETFGELPGMLIDFFTEAFGMLGRALPRIVGFIGRAILTVIIARFVLLPLAIGKAIVEIFTFAFNFLKTNLPKIVDVVITFFRELPGRLLQSLQNIGQFLVDAFTAAFDFLTQTLPTLIGPVLEWFIELPGKIWEALVDLGDRLQEAFGDAWVALSAWLTETAIPAVVTFFKELPGKIWNALGTIGDRLLEAFIAGWNMLKNWITQTAFPAVVQFFKDLPGKITSALSGFGGQLIGAFKSAWNAAANWLVYTGWPNLRNWITGLPGKIASAASGAFDGLVDALKSAIRAMARAWNRIDLKFTIPDVPGFPNRGKSYDLIPDVPVPFAALGGVFTRPTQLIAGEAGAEVIIPLTKPQRALELFIQSGLADVLAKARGAGSTIPVQRSTASTGGGAVLVQNIYTSNPIEAAAEASRRHRALRVALTLR